MKIKSNQKPLIQLSPVRSSRQVMRRALFQEAFYNMPRRAETDLFVGFIGRQINSRGEQARKPTLPVDRNVRREMARLLAKKTWKESYAKTERG